MNSPLRFAVGSIVTFVLAAWSTPCVIGQSSENERLERLERAVELLQKRNAELEREVSELKKETNQKTVAASPAKEKTPEGKTLVEKEKKPVVVLPGGSESRLSLGGFIQAQFEAGDVSAFEGRLSEGAIKDRFRLRRARITLSGDYAEQFDFKLEGDFELSDTGLTVRDATGRTLASNSSRTDFGATDVFINWHRFPEFNIKAGQYKAPFGLEQLTADTKLFTIERTLVTSALTPERQVGVELWGKPLTNFWPAQQNTLIYYAGIFNGDGRNISVNDNNEYMSVGRLETEALKGRLFNEDLALKFGVNGLTSRDEPGTNLSPAGNLLLAADGSLTSFSAPVAAERDAWGLDAALHLGPFDLIGEYLSERFHSRAARGSVGDFSDFQADGFYVQGSYFVLPSRLQVVTKYESFNPGQLDHDDIQSITGGINYYLKGDQIKLLANYIHTWSDFREVHPALGQSEFDEFIFRLQLIY